MEDWYNISKGDIEDNGGTALLTTYYNGLPSTALQSVYPEHSWDTERFKNKLFW